MRILLIQCALGLALLELCLRIYNPLTLRVRGSRIALPVRQHYVFSQANARKLDAIVHHTKNSLGFRGPDPPPDFQRRLTLVTVGGSTTECLLLSDGRTWTDVLARRVHAIDPQAWLNNAGLDGQTTYGHSVLLRDYIVELKPTFAIFLVGINDVGLERPSGFDGSLRPAATVAQAVRSFIVEHSEAAAVAASLYGGWRTHMENLGHGETEIESLPKRRDGEAAIQQALREHQRFLGAYAERLRRLVELSRSHRIEPIFVTQPALYGDGIDPATGVDLATAEFHPGKSGALEWRVLEAYNDVTRRVAADGGVLLIDLARELPKDSRLFYDFMHFTNDGAEAVGARIADRLIPYLEARTRHHS